jgi:peptide/nickel transport system substrate-binding protein
VPHHPKLRTGIVGLALLAALVPASQARHVEAAIPSGGTVIAAEADTPSSLNPYLNQQLSTVDIDSAIFDGLVKIDNKGTFQPDLATKWTVSSNGLNWTFNLNPKATWQDGVPVTSKDVVFTANLVNNPLFPATSTLGFDHIKSITAVSPTQVAITLKQAYAPFLQDYASSYILPQHVLGAIPVKSIRTNDQYNRRPLGSGPFEASDFVAADHVTLTANKAYFLGSPHLQQIIFRFVPSATTAVNQMRTGEANLAGQTADLSAQQYNELKNAPGLKGYNTPGFNWQHIDLIETGFFKDVKVRQALQMATSRQKVIQLVALGYGVPQYADQSPAKPFYDKAVEAYWPYDLTKAAAALAADGFTKGSGGTLEKGGVPFNVVFSVDSASPIGSEIGEIVKQDWGKLGISVTIKPLAPATIFGDGGPLYDKNRLSSSTLNAVEYEWIEPADPDDHYFWESNEIIGPKVSSGGNFDGYVNPVADKLMQQGLLTTDSTQRKAIYDKLQIILANDVPDIWLYWGNVTTVATSKLHGYIPNPFNYRTAWNAKDWYLQ